MGYSGHSRAVGRRTHGGGVLRRARSAGVAAAASASLLLFASPLRKEGGFSGRIVSAFGYKKWINRDYGIREQGPASLLGVSTFDLYYNRTDYNPLQWGVGTSWESKFDGIHAGLMYKRRLAPDQSFWWSN